MLLVVVFKFICMLFLERLKRVDYNMKLKIKKQLRQIAFSKMMSLFPLVRKVKTKGDKKRVKSTSGDSSTAQSPSSKEHVDYKFSDS